VAGGMKLVKRKEKSSSGMGRPTRLPLQLRLNTGAVTEAGGARVSAAAAIVGTGLHGATGGMACMAVVSETQKCKHTK